MGQCEFTVVIPARYASSRLPGKPLLDIAGKPMLQHVYETAARSGALEVIVATDDERVSAAADGFGALVHLTAGEHRSGTERIEQVVRERRVCPERIIVNVQGDEPLLPGALIGQVAELLQRRPEADVATLCEPITSLEELTSPGVVKVVRGAEDRALYFSRAPIPWHRESFFPAPRALPEGVTYWRHIGIYAYRAGYLTRFVAQGPAPVETVEALEQLRTLHHGGRVVIEEAGTGTGPGVDTREDLERVRCLLASGRPQ